MRFAPSFRAAAAPIALLLCAAALPAQSPDRSSLDLTEIRRLPVLHNGRYKPFDSYAREFVTSMTGEFRPNVFNESGPKIEPQRDPVLLYLEWIFDPEAATSRRQILIGDTETQKRIGVKALVQDDRFASYRQLKGNAKLKAELLRLKALGAAQWSPEDREVNQLYQRYLAFGEESGLADDERGVQGPPILPPPGEPQEKKPYHWFPVAAVDAFPEYAAAQKTAVREAFVGLMRAFEKNDAAAFTDASVALRVAIDALGAPTRPDQARLDREIVFNRVDPFGVAKWAYALAALCGILALIVRRRAFDVVALLPGLVALGYHCFGLHERTWLSGRALIGTFFESMLFVSAAAFAISLVFEAVFRNRWFFMLGSSLAFVGLTRALFDPHFMQPAIGNLQPVLINNFWINIHVPVIMSSYALVALSCLMGHVWLGMYMAVDRDSFAMKELSRMQYWILPPALILVFAGTVLGGVWADAAWGRFWGWDPKEIGAFVLFVAVTIVVHGRYAGWLKDFGTAIGTLSCGFALFVSYYGTNFFSGGMHSYAETGGNTAGRSFFDRVPWGVYAYLATEILFVAAATAVARARANDATTSDEASTEAASNDPRPEGGASQILGAPRRAS